MRQLIPLRFLVFGFTFLLRFYLELLLVLRRVLFVSALTGCFSGPCDLRSKRVPAHDVLHPRHPWPGMQLLAAHSKNELSISYLFQEELSPLFSPPLQEKENGTLMPKMSVPLASDSSSVQGWAKASKQIEAIKLLRCVLYVRSRATFSIRHPLGAHSVIVSNLFGKCPFGEPGQRQRYARAIRAVNFSRLFARRKHFASRSIHWRSENF